MGLRVRTEAVIELTSDEWNDLYQQMALSTQMLIAHVTQLKPMNPYPQPLSRLRRKGSRTFPPRSACGEGPGVG